jgi:uncharacterized membrane protein YfcA
VTLLAPELMPVSLLVAALLMPVITLTHDHHEIDWRGLAWSLPTRIPGTVLGAWLVVAVSDRGLGITVGLMVLASVVVTYRAVVVPVRPATLLAAGFVSGATGTATAIGGPPIAVLYQHRSAAQIRSTLAVYFLVGAFLSLLALVLGGEVGSRQVWAGLLLMPALVVGVWMARRVRRVSDPGSIRLGVLAVCAASAVTLLVRSALG